MFAGERRLGIYAVRTSVATTRANLLRRLFLCAGFCALLAATLAANPKLPGGFRIEPDGSLALGEIALRVQHFAPGSVSSTQSRSTVSGTPVTTANTWELAGQFTVGAHRLSFRETIASADAAVFTYKVQLESPEPVPTQQLALGFYLPVEMFVNLPLRVDDETFLLPSAPFAETKRWRKAKRLEFPTPQGRLVAEGALSVQLQDGRNFADKRHFRLRLLFAPEAGELRSSALAVTFRLLPYSAGDKKPAFSAPQEFITQADAQWQPIQQALFTQPGSVLDWSSLADAPAGKHGWVVVRSAFEGQLAFEKQPNTRVRFFGINICDRANYLSKDDCEKLAAQLVRLGHNAVRLHHYDRHLVKPGATLAAGWDTNKLDQFDYLFSCLKRAGLYVTIDLYTVRSVAAGEIQEINREVHLNEFKALAAISPSARANWKEFARRLLTHVNPYTGLAWKDDPALYSICLLNEDNTSAVWNSAPDIAALYEKQFAAWQSAHPSAGAREEQWARFLLEINAALARELTKFLRDLGVRSLITDQNYRQNIPLSLNRRELELVDNHAYHDLRKFLGEPFKLPYGFHQRSALANAAELPRTLFPARLFYKPYTVTEFNYCYPNPFRAEGGPLFGAYAALQDWDGMFRYAYAHSPEHALTNSPIVYLDNAADPINLLADRIAVLLFRRGDVQPAPTLVPYLATDDCFKLPDPLGKPNGYVPEEFEKLGLLTRVCTLVGGGLPANFPKHPFAVTREPATSKFKGPFDYHRSEQGILQRYLDTAADPARQSDLANQKYVSETGEICLDAKQKQLRIVTDRTECFVVTGQERLRGKAVEIENQGGFAVICVSAMDDRPLVDSRHLLIFHLTDVQNSGARFRDAGKSVLQDWGKLPLLVQRGEADIRLLPRSQPLHIRALRLDGTPAHAMDSRQDQGAQIFHAATIQPQGTFMLYEATAPR